MRRKRKCDLKKNDIVLIDDGNTKRINWSVDKIEELYPWKDEKFHVSKITTKTNSF